MEAHRWICVGSIGQVRKFSIIPALPESRQGEQRSVYLLRRRDDEWQAGMPHNWNPSAKPNDMEKNKHGNQQLIKNTDIE
jgi:hypothetical protein